MGRFACPWCRGRFLTALAAGAEHLSGSTALTLRLALWVEHDGCAAETTSR
jgi:hypothetical protein